MKKLTTVLIGLLFLAPSLSYAQTVTPAALQTQYQATLIQLIALLQQEVQQLVDQLASVQASVDNNTKAVATNTATINNATQSMSTQTGSVPVVPITPEFTISGQGDKFTISGNVNIDPKTLTLDFTNSDGAEVLWAGAYVDFTPSTVTGSVVGDKVSDNLFVADLAATNARGAAQIRKVDQYVLGSGKSITFQVNVNSTKPSVPFTATYVGNGKTLTFSGQTASSTDN